MPLNGKHRFVEKYAAKKPGYSNARGTLAKHVDDEDKIDTVAICDGIGRGCFEGEKMNFYKNNTEVCYERITDF